MRRKTKQREIFEAGVEAFAEYGFQGATMEKIAERAGISKGTIYLYASSKEDLLELLIREGFSRYKKDLEEKWAECCTPEEKLLTFIDHQIETARKYGKAYRSLLEEEVGLENRILKLTRRKRNQLLRMLEGLLVEAREKDKSRNGVSAHVLACLLLSTTSIWSMKLYQEQHISYRSLRRYLAALLVPQ